MKALFEIKKSTLKILLLVVLGAVTLFEFIFRIGAIAGAATTSTVFTHLIILVFMLAVLAFAIVALILGKEDFVKFIGLAYAAYYFFHCVAGVGSPLSYFNEMMPTIAIVDGVFVLILFLFYAAVGITIVALKFANKEKDHNFGLLVLFLIGFAFALVTLIVQIIFYFKADAGWYNYLGLIISDVLVPCGLVVGFLYYIKGEDQALIVEGE